MTLNRRFPFIVFYINDYMSMKLKSLTSQLNLDLVIEMAIISEFSYCRFGNVRENLIFANIREFVVSRIQSPRQY